MEGVSKLVARQYDAYAYPEPFADIAAKIVEGYSQLGDPALYAPMLWPSGRPNRRLRILAAGCGTVQAACLASPIAMLKWLASIFRNSPGA
jgi:hypothetical protein